MKTIKEKAAEYNYYNINDVPANVMNDKYFLERFEDYKESYNKIFIPESLFNLGFEIGVFCEVREQFKNNFKSQKKEHELYYIEHYSILLYDSENDNLLMLMCYKDKYYFHPINNKINKLTLNLTPSQINEAVNGLKEPNRIGVFTKNKILDWVKYCNNYINALVDASKNVNDEKLKNLSIINDFINSLTEKKVTSNKNSFYISTKHFDITLELLNSGTYLNKKVIFKGDLNSIINIENC